MNESVVTQSGATLMSVMMAMVLSAALAMGVSRILTGQSQVMKILELREQRMQLIRHYRDSVYTGLHHTLERNCGHGNFCSANGKVLIPSSGLYLSKNLYDYGNNVSSGKWWKVSATHASASKYGGNKAIELTVEFLSEQHPVTQAHLNPVTDVILLPSTP